MQDLHVHLHLNTESLTGTEGAIHIHLKPDGDRAKQAELSGGNAPTTSGMTARSAPRLPGGRTSGYTAKGLTADLVTSGTPPHTQSENRLRSLRDEQRIRSRIYQISFVPPTEDSGARAYYDNAQSSELAEGIMLELASGNQRDPIVWDSFRPQDQRGMWRFTVREEFGRLIGMISNSGDPSAIWVLSEWTPHATRRTRP